MKRDAQATRGRILAAATAEFAQFGLAGARVDRIAKAAGSNNAMIYRYFESKDKLFDAVLDAMIARNMNDVPVDVHDLPEYAARLYDQWHHYPEVLRLSTWDRLERGGRGMNVQAIVEADDFKVNMLRQAQQVGIISAEIPAPLLLELILALTQARPDTETRAESEEEHAARRQAIKAAVARVVAV